MKSDKFDAATDRLIQMGTGAFPTYRLILTDRSADSLLVSRVLGVLTRLNGDGCQLLPEVLDRSTDQDEKVRWRVVQCLGRFGGVYAGPVSVAAVSDGTLTVARAAAEALAAAGGTHELVALDARLLTAGKQWHPDYLKHIQNGRDLFDARLARCAKTVPALLVSANNPLTFVTTAPAVQPFLPPTRPTFPEQEGFGAREVLFHLDDSSGAGRDRLRSAGTKPFAGYQAVLANPAARAEQVTKILGLLAVLDPPPVVFLEPAVERLADPDPTVRRAAVRLIGRVGGAGDTSPLVALLSDESRDVALEAADALTTIGGRADVAALNVWLRAARNKKVSPELIEYVEGRRSALVERIGKRAR